MNLVKCDHHPDRDAVGTFKIVELKLGIRPMFLGSGLIIGEPVVDLCEECTEIMRTVKRIRAESAGETG